MPKFGGKGKQKQSGGFRILRADDLSVQHAGKDARNCLFHCVSSHIGNH